MQKSLIFLCAASLLAGRTQAQTRTAHQPAAKPAPRPVARPTAKTPPTAKPAARPAAPAAAAVVAPALVALAPAKQAAPAVPGRSANGQFGAGSNTLNLGIGFGLGYGSLLGGATTATPALSVSYMRGLLPAGPGTISVGGLAGYQSVGWESNGDKATWRNIYLGGRGAYHYNFGHPKLDTYAGLGLGVRVISYATNFDASATARSSQAELSGFVGARYFFSNKLGAFSELGYDMSYLKVGLSARF